MVAPNGCSVLWYRMAHIYSSLEDSCLTSKKSRFSCCWDKTIMLCEFSAIGLQYKDEYTYIFMNR